MGGMDYVLECALAKDYAPLIYQLRAGNNLTPELREFLAGHLEGKRQGKGKGASPRRNWEARRHYRLFYWLTQVEGDQRDHAYDRLAATHGISRRSAIDFVKLAEKTGHAEAVIAQERAVTEVLRIEANPEQYAVIEQFYMTRKAQILLGTFQEF